MKTQLDGIPYRPGEMKTQRIPHLTFILTGALFLLCMAAILWR